MVTPKKRSAVDLVVLMLSATVGIMLILSVVGVFILRLMHPEADTSRAAEAVSGLVQTIVGALVGFIGGRATGRWEGSNGKPTKHVKTENGT